MTVALSVARPSHAASRTLRREAGSPLIVTPTGQRPLRTVVGIDFGVTGFNEAAAPFQRGLLDALEMEHMEQPVSTAEATTT